MRAGWRFGPCDPLATPGCDPVSGAVTWADIEGLLKSVGCRVIEGRGSRVRFAKGDEIELFHRPHPDKEAKRYQVMAARPFLERLGVKP